MQINAIVTGATGMVGEGVVHECLRHPDVASVLVINRRPCGVKHAKLKEIIHRDFLDLSPIADQLSGYQACFFCLGVSSVGMKTDDYHRLTYDLTMHMARTLLADNPDMTFCYVSGAGTDSSEQGRVAWARIKGKTENHLRDLGFREAYMFRPGYIQPIKGLKNTYRTYKLLAPFYPILHWLFPKYTTTLHELGLAMITAATQGSDKAVLECQDIVELARKGETRA